MFSFDKKNIAIITSNKMFIKYTSTFTLVPLS